MSDFGDLEEKILSNAKKLHSRGIDQTEVFNMLDAGRDDSPIRRAYYGVREFTNEGAKTLGKLFDNKDWINESDANLKAIKSREDAWKRAEARRTGQKPEEVWNVSGGIGKALPYVAGGVAGGTSKAATLGGRLLGNIGRGIVPDLGLSAMEHGYKKDWDKKMAQEVGLGALGVGAGQVIGDKLIAPMWKKAFGGKTVPNTEIVKTEVPEQDIKIAKALTPSKERSTKELLDIVNGVPPKVDPQYRREITDPYYNPRADYEPNFRMVPNNPPILYKQQPNSRDEIETVSRLMGDDRYGTQQRKLREFRDGVTPKELLDETRAWYDDIKSKIPEEKFNEILQKVKADRLNMEAKIAERDALAGEPIGANGKPIFAMGGNTLGGGLGGGTLGGTEVAYEDIVEGKDKTLKDYLQGIGLGAAAGALLGGKYGDKTGTGMFVGAEPKILRETPPLNSRQVPKLTKTSPKDLVPTYAKGDFSNTADKQLRNWIDDSNVKITRQQGEAPLYRVMDHSALYEKYPELKKVKVVFEDMNDGVGGYYTPESSRITLNNKLSDDEIKSSLLHETQHGIQSLEDWARGGSPEEFIKENSRLTQDIPADPVTEYMRQAGEQEARATEAALKHPGVDPYQALIKEEGELKEPIVKFNDGQMMSGDNMGNRPKGSATVNANEAVTGAAGGGAVGATTDLDGDGKITYKDILYGALGGTAGAKAITSPKAKDVLRAIKDSDITDLFTGHKIYEKKDYMGLREDMLRKMNINMTEAEDLHRKLNLLSENTKKNMYQYMNGDKTVNLPPELKDMADSYTKEIDDLGQQLVDKGVLEQAQLDKFKGRYLHRAYTKHLGKTASELFSGNKKTIQGVHSRGNEWKGTEADYKDMMKKGEIGDFFDGKVEATRNPDGSYTFRQDWTPEQRESWGEIQDIAFALPETLARLKDMNVNADLLDDVLKKTGYVLDEVDDATREGYTQLNGKKYGALNGKWVKKDVANDIDQFAGQLFGRSDEAMAKARKAMRDYISLWKQSHTIYNPKAHMNNLTSNVTLQFMEGVNPVTAIENATRGAQAYKKVERLKDLTAKKILGLTEEELDELKKLKLDDDVKLFKDAEAAGLFGRSQLNDILMRYATGTQTGAQSAAGKIDQKLKKLYQAEDDIMRFSLLKTFTDRGMSFEDALKRVNKTIPDYTKPMSRAIAFLRNSGITPFASWLYYSTPILARQMKENPGRALSLIGSVYALYQAFGIDPYDERDIPQEGFSMKRIPIMRNGNEVTTLKADKWFPHAELMNPYEFIRGQMNLGAWQPAVDLYKNNSSYFNRKITNKEGAGKAYDLIKYGVQNVLPSPDIVDQVYNLAEGKIRSERARRKNNVITPRTTTEELLGIIPGLNILTYDKEAQRQKVNRAKIRDIKKRREDR